MRLRGGPWELDVTPDRGGRITSLRLGGEELLDQGIGVDDPSATGYVAAGARGWDEMVPNIDPARYPGEGTWAGVELPDHGEAWRLPWTVLEQAVGTAGMECSGRLLPWSLVRRIELREGVVRLTYRFRNGGDQPMYAYWCAHPLGYHHVAVEPATGGSDRPDPANPPPLLAPGSELDWWLEVRDRR